MPFLAILGIINEALPLLQAGASIIHSWRKNTDGTVTVSVELTQAADVAAADIKQATDWLTAHPKG